MFSCSLIPKEVIAQFGPGAVTLQVVAGGNAFGQVKFWSSDVIKVRCDWSAFHSGAVREEYDQQQFLLD